MSSGEGFSLVALKGREETGSLSRTAKRPAPLFGPAFLLWDLSDPEIKLRLVCQVRVCLVLW